jgi:hypothetical protein
MHAYRGKWYRYFLSACDTIIIRRYKEEEKMSTNSRLIPILLVFAFALAACKLPTGASETVGADAILTAAAQTVEANLTEAAVLNPPTVPPTTVTSSVPPSQTLPAPPTNLPPTATNTPICDLASYVTDVTIPDGTEFEPNDSFTKTWRLKNIGVCTWSGYSLVFDSGDAMSGPASSSIGSVSPGQEVDVSVNLKAPGSDGTYRGYWRIKNASGVLIPVASGYQGKSFFVDIKVKSPTPTATATTIASQPDLYISQITYNPTNPHMGDVITIKVSVYNGGNAIAGPSTAEWWPASGYPSATCSWAVGNLVAHGGQVYTCTYTYAGWSTYTTRAIADTTNAVAESDEGNNTLTQTLIVGP